MNYCFQKKRRKISRTRRRILEQLCKRTRNKQSVPHQSQRKPTETANKITKNKVQKSKPRLRSNERRTSRKSERLAREQKNPNTRLRRKKKKTSRKNEKLGREQKKDKPRLRRKKKKTSRENDELAREQKKDEPRRRRKKKRTSRENEELPREQKKDEPSLRSKEKKTSRENEELSREQKKDESSLRSKEKKTSRENDSKLVNIKSDSYEKKTKSIKRFKIKERGSRKTQIEQCSKDMLKTFKRQASTKKENKSGREKQNNSDGRNIHDLLLQYEEDKSRNLKKTSKRVQLIEDEINAIERVIRNINKKQQISCNEGEYDLLNELIEELGKLTRMKRAGIQNLLFYPYALEAQVKDPGQTRDAEFRKALVRANLVNLKACPGDERGYKCGEKSRSNSSPRAVSPGRMRSYNQMFRNIKLQNKNPVVTDAIVGNYDIEVNDFGEKIYSIKEESTPQDSQELVDNTEALEVLASLEFNTKDLIRQDLKEKNYFNTLCTLADKYKRFYVLNESLKHKVCVLNIVAKKQLDMPQAVRNKLWSHCEGLLDKLDTLDRTYRKLFETDGLQEVETFVVMSEQVRPYEKCYRLIETTELKKFLQLKMRHTQLMESIMRRKQEQADKKYW